MKKRNLLLMLLLAIGLPWAAMAQNRSVIEIGTGTSSSYYPLPGFYGYNYDVYLYTPDASSELNESDCTISSIAYNIKSNNTNSGAKIEIWLKDVDADYALAKATTFATYINGATKVVDDDEFSTSGTGWHTIPFTESTFDHEAGKTLLVAVRGVGCSGSGGCSRNVYYTSTTNMHWNLRQDTNDPGQNVEASYLNAERANIKLDIEPIATDCPNPRTLVASNVTAHGATMTWTMDDPEFVGEFNLEYKKTTEEEWTRIGMGNTRTYPLTGLVAETEYQVRIQTVCDPENTHWKNGSNFTTLEACPAPTNLAVTPNSITTHEATVTWTGTSESYVVMIGEENYLLHADFEGNAIPAAFTNSTTYPWTVTAGGANGSGYCAIPGNKGVNSSSSDLTFEVTGPCTVSFNAKVSSESGYDYGRFLIDATQKMQISGTQDWTSYSYEVTEGTHTLVWRYYKDGSSASGSDLFYVDDIVVSLGVSSWTEYTTSNQTYTFASLTPETPYQVKVKGNCGDNGYSAETEPVSFTTEASCLPPTGLTATQTDTGFHFEWDGETGMTYGYSWGLAGQEHGGSLSTRNNYIDLSFTQFEPNADYVFYVFKTCTNEDWSDDATIGFHTPCASYNIPYVYGFEEAAPFECWTVISGNITLINGYPNTGSYRLDFRGTTSNMIALPQFNEATNNLRVEFWTRPESTYGNSGKFAIGYMTDITDASTFVAVETYNSTEMTTNYVKKTVDFVNVPANANIAMRQFDCTTNYYWYVDDVTVKAIPSCLAPTDLAANASTTSAELSWTANSGETAWTLYWKESDATDYTEVANATNPYPLNGLTAATQYQYYVVANCSADDASDPSEVFTFSTECGIITIDATHSWEEGFEDYNVGTSTSSGAEVTDIQCWARVQVNSSTNSPFVYRNYSSAASTGLASLEMKTSNRVPVMVALPEFSESIDNLNIAFNYNCTNTNTTYTAELGYVTDVTDASTFTKLFDIPIPVDRYNGHSEYSQDLYENAAAANAPTGSRLAILISNTVYSPVPSWNFDDFVVSYVPPCRKPSGLALDEGYPTAHEVSFTWDAEEGEMFEFAMLPGTITDFSNVNWGQPKQTNTASWDNLYAEFEYTFAIRKVCGGEEGYSPVVSISFRTPQEPVSVPFADDFEDGQKWLLVNGGLTNAWAYGEATNNGGTHALYISNDGGNANAYTIGSAAMVYATKLFTFGDGIYKFSYDWIAYGESSCDYLRVALVPASVTLTAGTSAPTVPSGDFYNNLPEGWMALDGGGKLNLKSDWQSFASDEIEIAAGNYMMVFAWRNDGSVGTTPPAAVDNVSITKITCITPTGLAYSNVKSNKVDLTWTSDADAWQICINDDEENLVDVAANDVTIEEGVVAYTLTGLTAETDYTVKVRANCGSDDGVSAWTEAVSFTTIAPCSIEDVTISNITHYAADVTWTGESAAGYTVNYRTAAGVDGIEEEFGTSLPSGWENKSGLLSSVMGGTSFGSSAQWSFGSNNGVFDNHARINIYGSSRYGWLITPEITLASGAVFNFDLALTAYSGTGAASGTCDDDRFVVLVYANEAWTILREWNNSGSADVFNNIPTAGTNVSIDLSAYIGQTVKIAFYGESTESGNGDNNLHIDNVMIGTPIAAGEWQTIPATSEAISANLSGLTPGTRYDLQVVPNCDETLASETQQFSTVPENVKWFITEGNWGTATNWEPTGVPTIEQDVTLMANTTIESGCVAEANIISTNTHTLTIEDGAQLKHNNSSSFTATVKKNVTGYGADNYNTNNGYVVIGLPCTISLADDNSDGVNLRTGTYDLYTWSSTADLEWINHGSSDNDGIPLALSRFHGFLYANQEGAELIFTGDIYGSGNNYQGNIFYTAPSEEHKFSDWNLIGNPFVCDAYLYGVSSTGLESTLSYYKMNDAGNGFEAVEGGTVIAPMQGIFCQAPSGSYYYNIYFTRTAPVAQSEGKLNMNLRSANKQLDNAILVFGGDQQLGKMTFRANSSKIFMPVEGKDYAITSVEGQVGEVPVSFVPEKNGTYSLSFTSEEVSFSYLHLIDNMTGADVNLLQTPSYTFDARTSDYESRFRLVFATGSSANDDTFGFVNASGNFCIFGIEGEATVQVIDVLGHVLSSEQFSGSYEKKINGAPGVYMVRLINGNDIKVQKVVVR